MPRPVPFTDDQLREAVKISTTINEVCKSLGLLAGGGTYGLLRRHIARLSIDASHLSASLSGRLTDSSRVRRSDDEIRDVVRQSSGVSDALRRLAYKPCGGMHRWLKARIAVAGIDTSHFLGQSWARWNEQPCQLPAVPAPRDLGRTLELPDRETPQAAHRRGPQRGSLRNLWNHDLARRTLAASAGSHQRRAHRQPAGESPCPLPELPCTDRNLVQAESRRTGRAAGVVQMGRGFEPPSVARAELVGPGGFEPPLSRT
jgi:hypothetical protein